MSALPNNLGVPAPRKTIPFDYSFLFELTGQSQKLLSSTVTVSVEAAFVASSIGYGFVPRVEPLRFGGVPADFLPPLQTPAVLTANVVQREITGGLLFDPIFRVASKTFKETNLFNQGELGPLTSAAFENGIRINPQIVQQVLQSGRFGSLDPSLLSQLFEIVSPCADNLQFLYALFDQGTGRTFQSEPLLNTAGLGSPKGERPFRHFAVPIHFAPRTVIKMEITELTTTRGDLYVSLHGYKALGELGTPTGPGAQQRAPYGTIPPVTAPGGPIPSPEGQRRRRRTSS